MLTGENSSLSSSSYSTGTIKVEDYYFKYILEDDTEAPVLNGVSGPFSYASDTCTSTSVANKNISKGEKFCYKLLVSDNSNYPLKEVDRDLIKFIETSTSYGFDDNLIFASEIKSILKYPNFKAVLDERISNSVPLSVL